MATELESFRAWFAYIADARQGYLETFAKLPAAELSRDRSASYPTLLDIFAHSQGALYFWFQNCSTVPFPPQDAESDGPATVAVLRKDETYLQTQIRAFMERLTEGELSRTIPVKRKQPSPHDCNVPIREVLWHLVEEELQHRGEINALLWQIDVEPPIASWIDWGHDVGRIQDSSSK
ncbi:MAG: DinB family protein [Thermoplasmata archaeon]